MEQKVYFVFFVNLKGRFQIPERKGEVLSSYLPDGNAEADYSDASFTVNSCSVTIKPLKVPCFFFSVGFSRTTAKFERAGTLGRPYNYP